MKPAIIESTWLCNVSNGAQRSFPFSGTVRFVIGNDNHIFGVKISRGGLVAARFMVEKHVGRGGSVIIRIMGKAAHCLVFCNATVWQSLVNAH
jgi:hypothetical protein